MSGGQDKGSESPADGAAASDVPLQPVQVPRASRVARVTGYVKGWLGHFGISHLLLILIALHLFAMSFPSGNTSSAYVFDESYYVPAANDLLRWIPSNLEHPFFGKIWGALGIFLFGNDFFGWRIFYVLIGVAAVWALYELALVFFTREKALLAASMLGFETMFFIHTSLLLLEGPPILFALLGFLAYFKRRYYVTAAMLGLSVLSKEWGIYFVIALIMYHAWATWRAPFSKLFSRPNVRRLLTFMAIILVVVFIPLGVYDQAYHPYSSSQTVVSTVVVVDPNTNSTVTTTTTSVSHDYVTNPLQNFEYYFTYQTALKINAQDLQDPWDHLAWYWVLPLDINASQYFVTTVTITTTSSNGTVINTTYLHPIDWLGIGNLVVWYSFWAIIPILLYKVLRGKVTQLDALVGIWIAATYGPNLILSAVIHRVVYAFYFVNVDPALALGIPMVITFLAPNSNSTQKILMAAWLLATVIFFIAYFPVHPVDFR